MTIAILLSASPLLLAQSGGGFDVRWHDLASGGGAMSGANGYSMKGTVALPDANAGGAQSGGSNYTLRGGFWPGVNAGGDVIFRAGFE